MPQPSHKRPGVGRTPRYALAIVAAVLGFCGSAQANSCLKPSGWYATGRDGVRPAQGSDVLADMARRQVVLLGEQHDSADDHAWQLATLGALHLLHPKMVIGFEAFPRRTQPLLDAWIAGKLSERQFLERSDWAGVWGFPPGLYLPLFRFARINGIPMRALNVDHKLIQAISDKGWDAVPASQKEGVTRPASPSRAYLDDLFKVYQLHPEARGPQGARRNGPKFLHFVESQTTWDRAMAQGLAEAVRASAGGDNALVVGIMGSGHIRYGHGVAHQLRDLGIRSVGMLLPVRAGGDCSKLDGIADAVFAISTPPPSAPPPPRLGVRIEQTKDGVGVVEVVKGSLAEKTGLRAGDRFVSIAGAAVAGVDDVIRAVHQQPAGTWMPMRVRRGEQEIELVAKFPPRQ